MVRLRRGARVAVMGMIFALLAVLAVALFGCAEQQRELLGPLAVVPIGVFLPW